MIDPPPNWADVAFDPTAAHDAAEACDDLARTVREVGTWHDAASRSLGDTWEGVLAAVFAHEARELAARFDADEEVLRRCAASLRAAAAAAGEEQRERERGREQFWEREARRRARERARTVARVGGP